MIKSISVSQQRHGSQAERIAAWSRVRQQPQAQRLMHRIASTGAMNLQLAYLDTGHMEYRGLEDGIRRVMSSTINLLVPRDLEA